MKNKPEIVAKMTAVKNNIGGTREKGFLLYDKPENQTSQVVESVFVNGGVNYPWEDIPFEDLLQTYGTCHNHLENNPKNIGVFSPEDICVLRTNGLIETAPNNPYRKNTPEKSIGILFTKLGVFAIKINDLTKLQTFALKYENIVASGPKEVDKYLKRFFENPKEYNILPSSTHAEQVTGFLRFIKDEDIGIDLYEGNKNNFDGWKKLSLQDNGNGTFSHTAEPCN